MHEQPTQTPPSGAKIEGRNKITVNAAQISTPERARQVILEEGLHGVWNDPAVQRAWQEARARVTPDEMTAERAVRQAQGLPVDADTIREEATITRLIEQDANRGTIGRLFDAIRAAFKRTFGFDLPGSYRQQLKDAALEFLRNRDNWQGARGEFEIPPREQIGQQAFGRTQGQQRLFSSGEDLEAEKFRNQFLRWRLGELPADESLQLGRTPEALRAAGIPDGQLYIKQQTLNEKPKDPKHPYPVLKLARLPEALRDPILVHESWTEPNAYVALLDIEHGGKNMVAALHFRTTGRGLEVTEISSVYPRDAQQVIEAINRTGRKGGVVYWNKEKTRQWLARNSGFNSPQYLGPLSRQKNIPTNEDLGQGHFARGDYPPAEDEQDRKSKQAGAEAPGTEKVNVDASQQTPEDINDELERRHSSPRVAEGENAPHLVAAENYLDRGAATGEERAATGEEHAQEGSGEYDRQARLFQEWAAQTGRLIPQEYLERLGRISSGTSEHTVYLDPARDRAVKQTLPGQFGWIPKLSGGRWGLGIATPRDYLRRWQLFNRVFGSDVRLEGASISHEPSMVLGQTGPQISAVISQRWHQAADPRRPHPSADEVAGFLRGLGFEPLPNSFHGWQRKADGIVLIDARPDNFIKTREGVTAVDLPITRVGEMPERPR